MTSQKYSANKHAASYDLKRCYRFNLIPALFMLYYSIQQFIVFTISEFTQYYSFTSGTIKNSTLCNLTSDYTESGLPVYCILFGFLFAIVNLGFSNKRYINFHFSIPLDRAALFKNRTISAMSYMAGILLLAIGADYIINICFISEPLYIFKMALALYAECLMYCFVSYIIFSIGIYACYTVIEGLLFGTALICLPTAVTYVVNNFCQSFLKGYAREDFTSIFNWIEGYSEGSSFSQSSLLVSGANFNPFFFGKAIGSQTLDDTIFALCNNTAYNMYYYNDVSEKVKLRYLLPTVNHILPLIIWAVIFVGLVFLAKFVFVHKKAENTAIHASNKFAVLLFDAEAALCISSFAASNISSVLAEKYAYIIILISLLVFAAVFFILNAISIRKAVLPKKSYITGAAAGVCLVVICGVLSLGGFGYSKYVPEVDEIEMATITGMGIVDMDHNESSIDEYSSYPLGTVDSSGFAIFTDKEDLDKFTKVAESITAKSDDSVGTDISVVYKLKNGRMVYRNYKSADREAVYNVLSLTDTDAYRAQLEYLMLGDAKEESAFSKNLEAFGLSESDFSDYYNEIYPFDLNEMFDKGTVSFEHYGLDDTVRIENTTELRQALYADLTESTYEQRFKPDENEVAQIKFTSYYNYNEYYEYEDYDENFELYNDEYMDLDEEYVEPDEDEYYENCSSVFRIYPSMTNTVNYLKSIGVYAESKEYFVNQPSKAYITNIKNLKDDDYTLYSVDNYMFESCISYKYDYDEMYNSVEDTYGNKTVEDADKITSLLSVSRVYQYADDNDIVVLFVSKDKHNAPVYVPMLIKNSDAPEWAEKLIK